MFYNQELTPVLQFSTNLATPPRPPALGARRSGFRGKFQFGDPSSGTRRLRSAGRHVATRRLNLGGCAALRRRQLLECSFTSTPFWPFVSTDLRVAARRYRHPMIELAAIRGTTLGDLRSNRLSVQSKALFAPVLAHYIPFPRVNIRSRL